MADKTYCTYLGQSGFLIENSYATLLFDWYQGEFPSIRDDKPLYVFVSHIHSDHFNPKIFNLVCKYPNSEIYLGYDHSVPEFDEALEKYSKEVRDKICFFDGEQKLIVDTGDTDMIISSLKSTDEGVAYLIEFDGKTIFHAGDLFLMQIMSRDLYMQLHTMSLLGGSNEFIGSYEDFLRDEAVRFTEYTEPLRGKKIDYAMLPLDPRVYKVAEETIKRYMEIADIKCWSPMHLWGKYDFVDSFISKHLEYASNMIGTSNRNDVMDNIKVGDKYSIFACENGIASHNNEADRPDFTWEERAEYVVFNSITNNPKIGNEKNFVRIRKYESGKKLRNRVELEVGAEYEVAVWFHNNADSRLNDSGKGLATNVRLFIKVPQKVLKDHSAIIKGIIHAAEADPKDVWDTAHVHASSTVLLRYVANSATIHSLGSVNGTVLSSADMFGGNGVYLGYSTNHWGVVPGGNEYSGYVTFRFLVERAEN